ncbi:FAD-binding oxidoreductase [Burkholderia sp. BKH01]|uniref:NAD(P)/FAD-dependent oxidoreductase n=1 Tax=Burkholderia sp. BKH01 TaxID=2769262 RepID=UPI0021E00404|nr:FAD-binding oxidoreductase [Burkholderia sp. BKH01]MCU9952033.1 FAD-binding oxidoreductase [Burkholderia sp. BKH01]
MRNRIEKFPQVDGDLGWLETTPDFNASLGQRAKGAHEFDVAVIGAGFTGISLALRYAELEPSARIAVIDALRVGEGTSGRNAGFLIDLPHNLDGGKTNVTYARALYKLNVFAINRLREYKDRFAIPFWDDAGKYMSAHEEENESGLTSFVKMLGAAGFEYEQLSGRDLEKRLGTNYYRSAVYTPGNVLVNPAALVRGLTKALPKSVTLFENSPVTGIEYGKRHRLQFVGGSITAPIVVQATNSFSEEFGKLSRRLAPVFTYASLTPKLSGELIRRHFKGVKSWGTTSAHPAGSTVRFTVDKRIFVRNTLDFLPELKSTRAGLDNAWKQHRKSFEARFPFLKEMAFEYTWGGMLAMTLNHEPVFADAGEGVYVIGGCNGVGVVKGTYLGYYMAEHINKIKSDNLTFIQQNASPSWIPPDPLRTAGARLRLARESGNAGGDI